MVSSINMALSSRVCFEQPIASYYPVFNLPVVPGLFKRTIGEKLVVYLAEAVEFVLRLAFSRNFQGEPVRQLNPASLVRAVLLTKGNSVPLFLT